MDAEVWAYICLFAIHQKRYYEANQALKQAITHGLADLSLLKYEF
jgi:hypothetical protein